jgi:hypothetical protein
MIAAAACGQRLGQAGGVPDAGGPAAATVVNGRVNGRSMALVLLENGPGLDLDLSRTAKA